MSDRISQWSTYESNVQSYRSSMIASQSFLIAIAAITIDSMLICLGCVIIALSQLWFIWFIVIKYRVMIVDFYKFDLANNYNKFGDKIEDQNHTNYLLNERTYLKNKEVRVKINRDIGKKNMRTTRLM